MQEKDSERKGERGQRRIQIIHSIKTNKCNIKTHPREKRQINLLGLILMVRLLNPKQKWIVTKQFLLFLTKTIVFFLVRLNKI